VLGYEGRIDLSLVKVMVTALALLFSTDLAAQSIGFKQSLAQYVSLGSRYFSILPRAGLPARFGPDPQRKTARDWKR
jgi:hypothetical protein